MDIMGQLARIRDQQRQNLSIIPDFIQKFGPRKPMPTISPDYAPKAIHQPFNQGEAIRLDDRLSSAYPRMNPGKVVDRRINPEDRLPVPKGKLMGTIKTPNVPILLDRPAGVGQLQPANPITRQADEGGAGSPQIQRGSARSPIQGGGPSFRGLPTPMQGGSTDLSTRLRMNGIKVR